MELALRVEVHTYAGGLVCLPATTVRLARTSSFRWFCVSLLSRAGYFRQESIPTAVDRASRPMGLERWSRPLPAMIGCRSKSVT